MPTDFDPQSDPSGRSSVRLDYLNPATTQKPVSPGSIRLFRAFGVTVFLHWSWFFVALIEINNRQGQYTSMVFNLIEYISLFGIVLLHEFGHAMACRSVGGHADKITLWPLGGIAFVDPPQRAGAMLWSIAAGPLVNVVLVPMLFIVRLATRDLSPDIVQLVWSLNVINLSLLIFNMLPIFPLDGGQILRSVLWFFMGRGRSLLIASWIGIFGAVIIGLLSLLAGDWWLIIMAAYAASIAWRGIQSARMLELQDKMLMRRPIACPYCRSSPPAGAFWGCMCGKTFDTFETHGNCPHCGRSYPAAQCPVCRQWSPHSAWNGTDSAAAAGF